MVFGGQIRVDKTKLDGANNNMALFQFWSTFHVNWGK